MFFFYYKLLYREKAKGAMAVINFIFISFKHHLSLLHIRSVYQPTYYVLCSFVRLTEFTSVG